MTFVFGTIGVVSLAFVGGLAALAENAPPPAPAASAEPKEPRDPCGREPYRRGDGEIAAATRYMRAAANDPDSVSVEGCGKPFRSDELCWVSTCTVRARNGFGALVAARWRFAIIDGEVVAAEEAE